MAERRSLAGIGISAVLGWVVMLVGLAQLPLYTPLVYPDRYALPAPVAVADRPLVILLTLGIIFLPLMGVPFFWTITGRAMDSSPRLTARILVLLQDALFTVTVGSAAWILLLILYAQIFPLNTSEHLHLSNLFFIGIMIWSLALASLAGVVLARLATHHQLPRALAWINAVLIAIQLFCDFYVMAEPPAWMAMIAPLPMPICITLLCAYWLILATPHATNH